MSTLGAGRTPRRRSLRRLTATGMMMLTLGAVLGVVGPVLPALATHPTIEAEVVCTNGTVTINWISRSWLQDPNNDAASGNPEIFIRFNGVKVATGAYTAANNYEFSGSNPWPDLNVSSVLVLAYANAPFNNGEGQGTSRGRTVYLPEECTQVTTTTTQGTTTTTEGTTTTTEGTTTTTQGTTTTIPTNVPTTTTLATTTTAAVTTTTAATEVLGIQVSAPVAAQVTQSTLPFTGVSSGSLALLASAFAGLGLLLLLASRQSQEKSPARSWR